MLMLCISLVSHRLYRPTEDEITEILLPEGAEDETTYVLLPEGVLMLAQDQRSAVLGLRQVTNHSPVGTVRNRCLEHVSTQTRSCNPHGRQFLISQSWPDPNR